MDESDEAFFADFVAGRIEPAAFDHRAHLRAAACALVRLPFLEACIAVRDGLGKIAARAGRPTLYHETMTIAAMSLVADALDAERRVDLARLVERDPRLLDPRAIADRYAPATWTSAAARTRFRMPDAR